MHLNASELISITRTILSFLEVAWIGRAKLLTPLSKGFIAGDKASFNQKLLHFTKPQTESMVQPLRMTNNFSRKTMPLIDGRFGVHAPECAKHAFN